MKKFVKVMLIFAAVFAVLGIGLTAAGAAMGAGDQGVEVMQELERRFGNTFDYFYNEEWDEDEWDDDSDRGEKLQGTGSGDSRIYQVAAADKLDINLKYDELVLEEHDEQSIRVEVQNDPKNMVQVREKGSTLKITGNKKLEKKRRVIISYPKNMNFHEVELGVGAGNVEMNGNLNTDSLDVILGAGEFVNSGRITAAETELEVGAGNMTVTGLTTAELDGQCGVGDLSIEINGKESDYSYSLECGIGNITVGGEEYSGLGKEKRIKNPGAKGEIDLECGIGTISVAFTEK